jgi:hypothetical protein
VTRSLAHVLAAFISLGALALAYFARERYDALMEEDRAVEWATVMLFLVAGVVRSYRAIRTRRVFDALVGLFCLFVAGEEISWGQRLIWYPVTFTGEWIELLAGWLFLATAPLSPRAMALTAVAALPVAFAMTWISAARRPADRLHMACAQAEATALVDDIVRGHATTPALDEMGSIHKRVWGSVTAGFIDDRLLRGFRATSCPGDDGARAASARRRYVVDPWGTAYWVSVTREDESGTRRVIVYSFGPNRRRDGEPEATTGDDVAAEGVLR